MCDGVSEVWPVDMVGVVVEEWDLVFVYVVVE